MTTVTIDRELLERVEHVTRTLAPHLQCHADLVAILAAPPQPVEGLEVVGYINKEALASVPLAKFSLTRVWLSKSHSEEDDTALCRLTDTQGVIAGLREECERLRKESMSKVDTSVQLVGVCIERDTLRQQLAERDAEIERLRGRLEKAWLEGDRLSMQAYELQRVTEQRDKLAGLLREVMPDYAAPQGKGHLYAEVEAALTEVKPCPESPSPAPTT